jgi:response regulator RpfG family c-di-GMP phosphodiesterase
MTPMPENAPANILVVDDESSIRQALRVTLGTIGFDVAEAATGERAAKSGACRPVCRFSW